MKRLLSIAIVLLLALALAPAGAVVNSQVNKTIVGGNGSATQFTFSFIGVAAAYITVTYTDAGGNATVLTQGAGATQYQIALNPPVTGALWGVGGTVTYNPNGSPIASGTTLTILRTLPLTQAQSLQNQSSVGALGSGAETATDTVEMQVQQVNEATNRAILANPTNASAPLPLPPAAQAANQGLCFDGSGLNVVACALAPAGTISSAMQPVVNAGSLAAGRTAFGLGGIATEGIGSGLRDDGAGNVRIQTLLVSDATNQAVTAGFDRTARIATGPITYTLPRVNTLWNGFEFDVYAFTGVITFAINANDTVKGQASGVSLQVPPGFRVKLTTDGATFGTIYATLISIAQNQKQPTRCTILTTAATTCSNGGSQANNGTYTTPIGATRLFVRMVGAGGNGAAQGSNGTAGTGSSFGAVTVAGGPGGNQPSGAAGGANSATGTGGVGTASLRIPGMPGFAGQNTTTTTSGYGGPGGTSPFGGGWQLLGATCGSGGPGLQTASNSIGGPGGGAAGEYAELIINAPATSFAYTVGAPGVGGGTVACGGMIIVDEYYNFLLKRDLDPASNDNAPAWLAAVG